MRKIYVLMLRSGLAVSVYTEVMAGLADLAISIKGCVKPYFVGAGFQNEESVLKEINEMKGLE